MKKTLLSILSAILIFTTITPMLAKAESDLNYPLTSSNDILTGTSQEWTKLTKNNENERVAETIVNGVTTTATFDKELNILTVEQGEEKTIVLNLGKLSEQYLKEGLLSDKPKMLSEDGMYPLPSNQLIALYAATTKQDTFINYEYTITHSSPEKWQLRRPQDDSLFNYYYKNVTRTNANHLSLLNFQLQVESINDLEWRFIGSTLTGAGLSWLSFILSVPTAGAGTLTAGLAALGAYGATADAMVKIHGHVNKAKSYYFSV